MGWRKWQGHKPLVGRGRVDLMLEKKGPSEAAVSAAGLGCSTIVLAGMWGDELATFGGQCEITVL